MKFSRPILVLFFSTHLLTTEAHQAALAPAADSPSPSPSPMHHRTPHFKCRSLFFPFHNPLLLPKSIRSPALNHICAVTENPITCIALISPCLTGSINSSSALEAVIVSLFEHVKFALSFASKLSMEKSASSEIVTALNLSIELYVKVLDDLKEAWFAFKAHDTDTVKTALTAAITNFGRCDEAFHQQGLMKKRPLKKANHILILLAGFGLDIREKFIIKSH